MKTRRFQRFVVNSGPVITGIISTRKACENSGPQHLSRNHRDVSHTGRRRSRAMLYYQFEQLSNLTLAHHQLTLSMVKAWLSRVTCCQTTQAPRPTTASNNETPSQTSESRLKGSFQNQPHPTDSPTSMSQRNSTLQLMLWSNGGRHSSADPTIRGPISSPFPNQNRHKGAPTRTRSGGGSSSPRQTCIH